jgi:hypothetical protein
MRVRIANHIRRQLRRGEEGFTMLVTIGVLLVGSLLLAAAFAAAEGDISLSHRSTTSKQAYYAAVAGIQEYEDQLQLEPNYWEKCLNINKTIGSESASERYVVVPKPAEHPATGQPFEKCEPSAPFTSMIEKGGSAAANAFRIESTGTAGPATKQSTTKLVATFKVSGFLNYVYFTHYEDEDPELYNAPSGCSEAYYNERPSSCATIVFANGDSVNGPMHTDDGAAIECGAAPIFGRPNRAIPDTVEMNHGYYADGNCSAKPVFNTEGKVPTTGAELLPPERDSSLTQYVLPADEFTGLTHIVLNGEKIEVTNASINNGKPETITWPENDLIYVKNSSTTACSYTFGTHYANDELDTEAEEGEEANCGTVFVNGKYAKPLTIASERDVIINGNILPSAIAKAGEAPPASDTATLGLIANNFVRIYHPLEEKCEMVTEYERVEVGKSRPPKYEEKPKKTEEVCKLTGKNGSASLKNPWIYAAILATTSSFLVDNYNQGATLEDLNIYGAIAQNYRGIVGESSSHGYLKNYIYDERLAIDEPPYFLQPLNAEWKVARETATSGG